MKAKFFALLAVVLAVVSCQKDVDNLDVNMGGDVATISVTLPEDAITRAGGTDSAASGLDNTDKIVRVVMHIYDEAGRVSNNRYVDYLEGDARTVNFDIRLVPDRQYTFVAWADQVDKKEDEDKYFNTKSEYGLAYVTPMSGTWTAMNEERDAFTATHTEANFTSASNITLKLIRPFAKLRVVTTDMEFLNDLDVQPKTAKVSYATKHYNAFNAVAGVAINKENTGVEHEYDIASYGEDWRNGADMTLFTDYFFAADDQEEVVNFTLKVYDQDGVIIGKETNFNTPIPVKRNNLTTIAGNILTEGNNVTVTVDPVFAGKQEWPSESAEKLAAAAMFGGEVTLTEDVVLNQPLDVKSNMTLNLGDKTLKGVINVNEDAKLTVNNGTIVNEDKSMSGITSNGDLTLNDVNIVSARHAVRIESGNVVINGGTYEVDPISKSTLHALNVGDNNTVANVTIKGGKFIGPKGTMADSGSALNVRSGSTVTIEGGDFSGGKTKTLSANQNATLTVKGGIFDQNPANYVATGYKAIAKDGKFAVVAEDVDNVVANKADMKTVLEAAASAGSTNVVVDAMGANIGDLNSGLTKEMVPAGSTVTIRNAVVEGQSYGNGVNGTVIFDGCTFNNSGAYSIHFDNGNGDVIFKNCRLYGWNSFASSLNSVSFENCTLDGNGTYALIRSYADLTLKNCVIDTTLANHTDAYTDGVQVIDATLTEENVTYIDNHTAYLQNVLKAGKHVVLSSDLTINEGEMMTAPYGNKMALHHNGGLFDGNNKTLSVTIGGDHYAVMTSGGTIKDLTVNNGFRGVLIMYPKETIYLENVVSGGDGVCYALNTAEGDSTQDLVATNCTFDGWCSWSEIKSATFTNCTFGQGTYYTNVFGRLGKPYVNTVFDGCDFCSKYYIDLSALKADQKVTVKNCTVNGVKITAENWTSLVAPEDTCGEGQISVELKNGTYLTAENVADYIVFE